MSLQDRPRQEQAKTPDVVVDPRDLAAAIVQAAREMRSERTYKTETQPPTPPAARPPARRIVADGSEP
jgi:hypothetical protein